MMDKKKKRLLVLAAFGVLLIGAAAFSPYRLIIVSGESMSPTYHSGRLLLGRKPTVLPEHPVPAGRGRALPARKRDLPEAHLRAAGDEVVIFRLDEGFNLLVQTADYIRYYRLAEEIGQARIDRFEVPEGELFLLGDAPQISLDSRDFGPVPQSAVIARIPADR